MYIAYILSNKKLKKKKALTVDNNTIKNLFQVSIQGFYLEHTKNLQ